MNFESLTVSDWLLIGGGIVMFIYIIRIYNNLASLRENIHEAYANIRALLKQRHDEIPDIIDSIKQYVKYETAIIKEIMDARRKIWESKDNPENASSLIEAEGNLRRTLNKLFILAEGNIE
ncbi:LemA, partial [Candidatus Magnetomorum sp. HK-1]